MHSWFEQGVLEGLARSASMVERELAVWLGPQAAARPAAWRLRRYQRKIDVAHKVFAAYDERIEKAIATAPITPIGYLALALVFLAAARWEDGVDEASRARLLGWVNSAYNALDHAVDRPQGLLNELDLQCKRGLAP